MMQWVLLYRREEEDDLALQNEQTHEFNAFCFGPPFVTAGTMSETSHNHVVVV